jgi:tetratricopeptide (TPR) repeat protein
MTDIQALDNRITESRKQENLDDLAEALVIRANALVEVGQIAQARLDLDEAANIHHTCARIYDEARCTHLAATLCRLEGNLDAAQSRAEYAAQLATPGTPIAVSTATELGEIALLRGEAPAAAVAYGRAIAEGKTAGLIESAQAALLRKRAIALVASNRYPEAVQDLETAYSLLLQIDDQTNALRTLIETATALQQSGNLARAEQVRRDALAIAEQTADYHAMADLYILESAQAVEQKNIPLAMTAAQFAQTHALKAVAPIPYISAAITISQLAEASGDYLSAYEALAVGWVTLSDLLGREIAKSTFEPKLIEIRDRWGIETFNQVKSIYEAKRRWQQQ